MLRTSSIVHSTRPTTATEASMHTHVCKYTTVHRPCICRSAHLHHQRQQHPPPPPRPHWRWRASSPPVVVVIEWCCDSSCMRAHEHAGTHRHTRIHTLYSSARRSKSMYACIRSKVISGPIPTPPVLAFFLPPCVSGVCNAMRGRTDGTKRVS